MRRLSSFSMALVAVVSVSTCPRPASAAVAAQPSVEQFAEAWMGAVALLADDGDERGRGARERDREGCGECERRDGGRGGRGAAGPGPQGTAERSRAAAAKMDEILARLARIEAKLDGRAGGPPRIEMRGPRPPMAGPGPRPEGRPEVPEEVREQMRRRMEEGRERMEQARRAFRQMEERIKKLEAEIERLKADR